MKTLTVLKNVLDLYSDKTRWVQETYHDIVPGTTRKQCYCLVGGVRKAITGTPYRPKEGSGEYDTYSAVLARLVPFTPGHAGDNEGQVIGWNDTHGRTIGEIRTALRKAIKAEEKAAA